MPQNDQECPPWGKQTSSAYCIATLGKCGSNDRDLACIYADLQHIEKLVKCKGDTCPFSVAAQFTKISVQVLNSLCTANFPIWDLHLLSLVGLKGVLRCTTMMSRARLCCGYSDYEKECIVLNKYSIFKTKLRNFSSIKVNTTCTVSCSKKLWKLALRDRKAWLCLYDTDLSRISVPQCCFWRSI